MKQLVCEMCGSTGLIKDGGVFVCQSCGCKYSTEEARKMMVEGTVSVEGTVKVDNTQLSENYLSMAQSAADSGNEAEAESYANKVLELEPTNWKALYIKGNAAGWRSGTRNNRLPEAIDYFSQAISNCDDESELEGLKDKIAADVSKLALAMIGLSCDHFAKFPSAENAQSILKEAGNSFLLTLKLIATCGTAPDDFKAQAARLMNSCVVQAWKSIWNDYTNGKPIQPQALATPYDRNLYSHPSERDWRRFYERADACMSILKTAIALDDNDDEEDLQRYENLIFIAEQTIDSHSVAYSPGSAYFSAEWLVEYAFTVEAKKARRQQIDEWKKAKDEIDPAKKAERARIEEKKRGEAARVDLRVRFFSEYPELNEAFDKAEELKRATVREKKAAEKELKALGLFSRKERKELERRIGEIEKELARLEEVINKIVDKRDRWVEEHLPTSLK